MVEWLEDSVEEIIETYEGLIREKAITEVEAYNKTLPEEETPETPLATIVRGRLLDSPEKYAPCCEIYHDPGNGSELNEKEMIIGSTAWIHHLVIEVSFFETRLGRNRATAREDAFKVFNRVKRAILENPMLSLSQEGGYGNEAALRKFVYEEEGGPPKSWIWKAKYWIRVKTERV